MSYLFEKISQYARQRPAATAITSPHEVISYAQLKTEVDALAIELNTAGYRCIGLLGDNSINWALIDLACLQARICCIPVPGFFTRQQIRHLCDAAGVQALIGDGDAVDACGIELMDDSYRGARELVMRTLRTVPSSTPHPLQGVAKVTFTSGSTGTPKGVCLGRDHIENTLQALDRVVRQGTSCRHLSVLPLVTLLENIAGLYLSLMQGAEIMLYPMSDIGFTNLAALDEKIFFRLLNKARPHSLILVPELLRLLVHGVQQKFVAADSFRFIAVGGGVVSETVLQQATKLGLPVLQGYGLSECASVVSLNSPGDNRPGSVGKPLQHVAVKIADDGEIMIAGNNLSAYLGEPVMHEKWLATGDLGRLDGDGYLYVTGRKKNLLVTAFGKNVSPEWVESVFQQSPLIKQIVVTGEASTQLRALIVPAATVSSDQFDAVMGAINEQLPEYARVGGYQLTTTGFLYENGFLTPNGRLKRAAIAEYYQ